MITFLDEYRKSAWAARRSRGAYLDPTSRAEALLAERWATAERLMRLFNLSWSQAAAMASRMGDPRAAESGSDAADDDGGVDRVGSPARNGTRGGTF